MSEVVFTIDEIRQCLPHRYPFLLIDKIIELVPDQKVVGIKNVTINEPFFQGHFPTEPVMPGVLIIECMAQTGAIMLMQNPALRGSISWLVGIERARFRKPVRPGDQLVISAQLTRFRSKMGKIKAIAEVDALVVAEAEISFVLSDVVEGVRK